ncbi:type II toxin-antitoxin system VapC family toxin [Sinomonas sp. ASV486]|uniref:type II toxin-antitoxin system VapC family toxin n=1 Tax=Sinomonas sp. ASV486 TaxID=3051170 RepID=UPI0027DD92C5|nr:type II toxin-antitoxin system VapC family toxin [Sinomonas sp. ASV486]MDQ4489000.1 type II toxin-antitoxin system VapC family toxin [Sinomonas sp. ASV486]
MGKPPYLLDTHALVWALTEPRRLSRKAKNALESWDSVLLASAASAYELSYKRRMGRLPGLDGLFVGYRRHVLELVSEEIGISGVHALEAGQLDWGHRDPFDRLIAAQALVEGFGLITADPAFRDVEGLDVLW